MMNYFDTYKAKYSNWQQDRQEIEAVARLINANCAVKSYLEIGTAEGGSLYYFGHMLAPHKAVCVDLAEAHTATLREWVFSEMKDAIDITLYAGNSTEPAIIDAVKSLGQFDVVFIDGGHDYATVKSDWESYGFLAAKFVVFHDICLPDVKKLWDTIPQPKLSIVETGKFGMGVVFK